MPQKTGTGVTILYDSDIGNMSCRRRIRFQGVTLIHSERLWRCPTADLLSGGEVCGRDLEGIPQWGAGDCFYQLNSLLPLSALGVNTYVSGENHWLAN